VFSVFLKKQATYFSACTVAKYLLPASPLKENIETNILDIKKSRAWAMKYLKRMVQL